LESVKWNEYGSLIEFNKMIKTVCYD